MNYLVKFTLDGKKCSTCGEMSYPSKEAYKNKSFSKKAALEIAMRFIHCYLVANQLDYRSGHVNFTKITLSPNP